MQEYVVRIQFTDRPGLGYKIFELMEACRTDKIAMEVLSGQGMFIKFRCDSDDIAAQLAEQLAGVDGVNQVMFHEQMPQAEREQELRAILNSVNEGILAIDGNGRISHINEVACRLLACTPQLAGSPVTELLGDKTPLFESLQKGTVYRLKEGRIKKDGQFIHFVISCEPVRNEAGKIIGAVSTLRDLRQMETMVSKVSRMRQFKTFDQIVQQSFAMRQLVGYAKTVAKSSSTVLLQGESGTGKELLATAIHAESPRFSAPFIAVNCGALPDTLLESELFGYAEGAFTGALKGGKQGLFEQANGGTLFLDEIGELSLVMQVKLLRVLQEGTIRKIGGNGEIPVDVRIIAATNRDLENMLLRGAFREDLYYRLQVIPLYLPPMRDRKEDIPLLAQQLVQKICAKLDHEPVRLSEDSMDFLIAQSWPGNVRQLENTLERIVNLSASDEITLEQLKAWGNIGEVRAKPLKPKQQTFQFHLPEDGEWPPLKEIVAGVEKEVLRQVMKKYPSSRLAGQVLGVSNTTVLNKLKLYRI